MKKYYDNWERDRITDNEYIDLYTAVEKLKDYISEYPEDYLAYIHYIRLLIDAKDLKEAEVLLSNITNSTIYTNFINNSSGKVKDNAKSSLLREKLRLLLFNKKYREAYELCEKYKYEIGTTEGQIFMAELFLANKLGLEVEISNEAYTRAQITNYSDERFIEHTKRHIEGNSSALFSDDFPFDRVFAELKEIIPNSENNVYDVFMDKYNFKYDLCGVADGKLTSYFRVVTLFDSDNFITMFPFKEGENFKSIDLNYLKEDKPKIRTKSQTDKFNAKYSKILNK